MPSPPAGTIHLCVMPAGGKSWPKIVLAVHSADALRIVTQLCIKTECSSVKKWTQHEILSMLKKIMKIDAFKPLKLKCFDLQT